MSPELPDWDQNVRKRAAIRASPMTTARGLNLNRAGLCLLGPISDKGVYLRREGGGSARSMRATKWKNSLWGARFLPKVTPHQVILKEERKAPPAGSPTWAPT